MIAAEQPESFLTRLNPLTKIAAAVLLTTFALLLRSPWALAMLALLIVGLAVAGRVRLGWRGTVFLLVPVAIVAGGNYLVSDSIEDAARFGLRLAVLFGGIPICALTTRPADLVRSLTWLRLPAGLLIALLLVWRFVPVLARFLAEIREANMLRGPWRGNRFRRAYRTVIMPLMTMSVDYAERVGMALELRGFDPGRPRTWYRVPGWGLRDLAFSIVVLTVVTLAACWQWGGPVA